MVNTLTWRDVAAPDFGTSIEGVKTAAQLLSGATTGASQALGAFKTGNEADATNALALAAAKYTNPDDLKAALAADPTLGVNPANLKAGAVNALQDHVTTLLNQASTAQNTSDAAQITSQSAIKFGEDQDTYKNLKAATPDLDTAIALAASNPNDTNTQNTARAMLAQAATKYGLTPDELTSSIGATQGIRAKDTTNAGDLIANQGKVIDNAGGLIHNQGSIIGNAQAASNLAHGNQDYNDNQAAKAAVVKINNEANDADSAMAAFTQDPEIQKLSPAARYAALNDINQRFPNNPAVQAAMAQTGGAAGTIPNASSSGSTGFADPDAIYGNGKFGKPSNPVSQQTLANVLQTGSNLIQATKGKIGQGNLGTSATGMYQLTDDTIKQFAPKALGSAWQSATYTPENQDKIAQEVFNSANGNGSALAARWSSLGQHFSPSQIANIAKMPWETARNYITSGESGGPVPANLGKAATDAISGFVAKASDNGTIGPSAPMIAAAYNDNTSTPADIAQQLAGKFGGKAADYIDTVNDVTNRSKKSPAIAGALIASNIASHTDTGFFSRVLGSGNTNIGSGLSINKKGLDDAITAASSGALDKQVSAFNSLSTDAASIGSLRDSYNTAQAAYQAAVNAGSTKPGIAIQIPRLAARVAAARSALLSATTAAQTSQPVTTAQAQPFGGPWISLHR